MTLVPVPAWASPFNFQAQVGSGSVRYSGSYAVPDQPLDAHVVLPGVIPYIGGTWGLLPTQLKLALAANSLGTRETGGLSAQGGFGLGQRIYTLSAGGNIYGTLTHDALTFESDPLSLSTPPISFQKHVGLLTLIPGASALFDLPVIGSLLQALDSALGVTAEIHGSMTGRGRLGVSGSSLGLTQGSYDAALGTLATAGLNTPIAWATVSGGGDGSLSMQIVPATKVLACQVLLSFQARAGALGFDVVKIGQDYSLYTCTTASGQALLVSAIPDQAVITTYGSPSPIRVEQSLSLAQSTNGLTETVLVEDASPQARPALVAGPDGQMALAWNSVSASGAADAVSLRLFDGSVWGDALTLSRAGYPAFTPSAAFAANGHLLVSWAEAQVAPGPGGLTEDFARSLEIAWVEVNPATSADTEHPQVLQRGSLTSDNLMDFAPRLSAAGDGSVWLAWQNSPAANMAGTAASPNKWEAAAWTGSGWTATEMVGDNGVGSLFWEIAARDANRVWMVADVDTDGDLSTATDREIFVYKRTAAGWAAPYRLTDDSEIDSGPLLTLTPAGQPLLAWRHGDSVMGLEGDPASVQPQVWFDAPQGDGSASVSPMLAAGRLLAGVDGVRALLWADGDAQGQDVWFSRFDPAAQTWSQPAPLFHSAEMRQALSAALLPGGDILLGLASVPVTSRTVTFQGGGTADVPDVGDAARLLVARIPAGYTPAEGNLLFLPMIRR